MQSRRSHQKRSLVVPHLVRRTPLAPHQLGKKSRKQTGITVGKPSYVESAGGRASFRRTVKPKPYMSLKDSTHLTTHEQQLRAYRAHEDMLQNHLNEPEYLLEVADKLLHLPETFPASYLQLLDPLVPQCLKLSGSLQFIDLEAMLGSNAPELDRPPSRIPL